MPLLCVFDQIVCARRILTSTQDLRALCGPHDPEMGRLLRPDTLRAKFGGKDSVDNGVHCTDLEEDGQLEVEYFFKILQ